MRYIIVRNQTMGYSVVDTKPSMAKTMCVCDGWDCWDHANEIARALNESHDRLQDAFRVPSVLGVVNTSVSPANVTGITGNRFVSG